MPAKFMNARLIAIRDALVCAHCASSFRGSDSQAWKVAYENKRVYCSQTCRSAACSARLSRPVPVHGPCRHCGKMFPSRTAKQYCSIDCYTKSQAFHDMLAQARQASQSAEAIEKRADQLRTGKHVPCAQCGEKFYLKRSYLATRRFCSKNCYRAFMAQRFDRWIANPESMTLPQCYDEFLDQEELTCIVDGCAWKGRHLSVHVNQAHGLPAADLKRLAGFNQNSGIVAKPLSEKLRDNTLRRGLIPTLSDAERRNAIAASVAARTQKSLEAREHLKKARLLSGPGPQRTCRGCGQVFRQSTPCGRALYCSPTCRDATYAKANKAKSAQSGFRRDRHPDGTFHWTRESPYPHTDSGVTSTPSDEE